MPLALTTPSLGQSSAIPGMASVPPGDLFALSTPSPHSFKERSPSRVSAGASLLTRIGVTTRSTSRDSNQSSVVRVPDTPEVRGLYKKLWSSDSLIRVETIPELELFLHRGADHHGNSEARLDLGDRREDEAGSRGGARARRSLSRPALHLIHVRSSREIERGGRQLLCLFGR